MFVIRKWTRLNVLQSNQSPKRLEIKASLKAIRTFYEDVLISVSAA